jgi:transcriptional regulator with XRE-family HTH domain
MGKASQKRPNRLGEKLLGIRNGLNLSQSEMINLLGFGDEITQSQISAFERNARIPSLIVLLNYARCVGINLEILIDDKMDLPKTISGNKDFQK